MLRKGVFVDYLPIPSSGHRLTCYEDLSTNKSLKRHYHDHHRVARSHLKWKLTLVLVIIH